MQLSITIWKVIRGVGIHLFLMTQACSPSLGLLQSEFVIPVFLGYMLSIIASGNALQISDLMESDKARVSKTIATVANVGLGISVVFFLIRMLLMQYMVEASLWASIFMVVYGFIFGAASSASLMALDKKFQF